MLWHRGLGVAVFAAPEAWRAAKITYIYTHTMLYIYIYIYSIVYAIYKYIMCIYIYICHLHIYIYIAYMYSTQIISSRRPQSHPPEEPDEQGRVWKQRRDLVEWSPLRPTKAEVGIINIINVTYTISQAEISITAKLRAELYTNSASL